MCFCTVSLGFFRMCSLLVGSCVFQGVFARGSGCRGLWSPQGRTFVLSLALVGVSCTLLGSLGALLGALGTVWDSLGAILVRMRFQNGAKNRWFGAQVACELNRYISRGLWWLCGGSRGSFLILCLYLFSGFTSTF